MKPAITIFLFVLLYFGCSSCSQNASNDQVVDKTEAYVQAKKDWTRLKNKTRVDGYTRLEDSIYGGEIACDIEPLKGVDAETFEVLPGTQYA